MWMTLAGFKTIPTSHPTGQTKPMVENITIEIQAIGEIQASHKREEPKEREGVYLIHMCSFRKPGTSSSLLQELRGSRRGPLGGCLSGGVDSKS